MTLFAHRRAFHSRHILPLKAGGGILKDRILMVIENLALPRYMHFFFHFSPEPRMLGLQ
jgi:hypothetical protein